LRPVPRVSIGDIEDAKNRIRGTAYRTPIVPASRFDDGKIYLKLECLQRTGSFKIRGAWNRMSRSTPEELRRGFVTISAGNHGQAVAWCAKKLGSSCTVFVPEDAVQRKVESIQSMGATIVRKPHEEIMESMVDDRMEKLGWVFIHPFGDPAVVAGQATIGLEILEDLPEVRTVVVPVGGGGLINGVARALRVKKHEVKIFGIQAEGAAPLPLSLSSGMPARVGQPKTIADGIAATFVFDYMFPLFKENQIEALTVTDDEIKGAIKFIMKESHAIAEPAGASSLAAAIRYRSRMEEPILCVVSGGNADQQLLSKLLTD
jgi:threonine dehydratase